MTEEEILDTGKCCFKITKDGVMKIKCGETIEELTPDQTRLLHGITELAEELNGRNEFKGNVKEGKTEDGKEKGLQTETETDT